MIKLFAILGAVALVVFATITNTIIHDAQAATANLDISNATTLTGTGFTYDSGTKAVTFDANANGNTYYITGNGGAVTTQLAIPAGVNTNIIIDNVTISGGNLAPILVANGGVLDLEITGTNSLSSLTTANKAGIEVGTGAGITVSGTGALTALAGGSGAGIGGSGQDGGGTINITSGTISSTGGTNGAGIGGGGSIGGTANNAGGTINISGGTVTANGNGIGSGIGGGCRGSGGDITISGTAKVVAIGGIYTGSATTYPQGSGSGIGIGGRGNVLEPSWSNNFGDRTHATISISETATVLAYANAASIAIDSATGNQGDGYYINGHFNEDNAIVSLRAFALGVSTPLTDLMMAGATYRSVGFTTKSATSGFYNIYQMAGTSRGTSIVIDGTDDIDIPSGRGDYTEVTALATSTIDPNSTPYLVDVNPAAGPTSGGNTVSINGFGFLSPVPYVSFSGNNGANGQWIDTGINQTGDTRVEVDYQVTSTMSGGVLFGSRVSASSNALGFWPMQGSPVQYRADYGATYESFGLANVQRNTVVVDNGIFTVDGGTPFTSASYGSPPTVGYPIYLGAMNAAGTTNFTFTGNVYSFKIFKNGNSTPVADYMPINNGQTIEGQTATAVGFYDKISHTIKYPASGSTGSLTYGSSTLTPAVNSVSIGGVPATNVQVASNNELIVTVPAYTGAVLSSDLTVDVGVTINDREYSLLGAYTYQVPTITSVVPNTGPTAGGNTVIINGTGFMPEFPGYTRIAGGITFDGTQYLDTGIQFLTTDNEVDWELDAAIERNSTANYGNGLLWSPAPLNKTFRFYIQTNTGGTIRAGFGTSTNLVMLNPNDEARHRLNIRYNRTNASGYYKTDNGVENVFSQAAPTSNTSSILIGAMRDNATDIAYYAKETVYGSKFYKNGVLVLDLVPVQQNSTGARGFIDTITGDFYQQPTGAGAFTTVAATPSTVSVSIGGQPATYINVLSDTQISCTVPASTLPGTDATVDVEVTVDGVTSIPVAPADNDYTYKGPYIALSSDKSTATLHPSMTAGAGEAYDSVDLMVSTDLTTGYKLSISAVQPALVCSSGPQIGALGVTGNLTTEKWGYGVGSVSAAAGLWSGVTTTPTQFDNYGSAVELPAHRDTYLWFGTKVNSVTPACVYETEVTILAQGDV